jgi:Kef-type K+ transport system membrane component KefB
MVAISFNSVLIIAGISVLVPVVLGLLPRFPVPGVVLQVVAGIIVGPSVLGWARIDPAVEVLSDLGLGMLLFLAGLEIDVERLRGPLARLAGVAFAVSAALGLLCAFFFWLAGQAAEPFLLAIILMSTSAGLLLPLLKDAGEAATEFGQLVMTAAAVAEIVPIMLMSLFFSAASKTTADQLVSLAIFLALLILIGLILARVRRLRGLDRLLDHLEDRSGQLRVRATLTLALACGVLAYRFGFASILGAFAAGLLVRLIEFSGREPNAQFMAKLEGIGFGFLIPIFFISTGVAFQLKALLSHPVALAEVPLFLIALLAVRGLPALLYRRSMGARRAAAAGLLQATTLTFVIVATQIGLATGKITPTTAASLVAAGLLTAALFPGGALRLLARAEPVRSGSLRRYRAASGPGSSGGALVLAAASAAVIPTSAGVIGADRCSTTATRGKTRTDSTPAPTSAAALAGSMTPSFWPISTRAISSGSVVAVMNVISTRCRAARARR